MHGSKLYFPIEAMKFITPYLFKHVGVTDSSLSSVVNFHNRLVDYIYLMFAFGAGLRSVSEPIEDKNLIDFETGLWVINEKQIRSVDNLRLIIIPDLLLEQLKAYLEHLKHLSRKFVLMNARVAIQIEILLSESSVEPKAFPLLFYFTPGMAVSKNMSPSKIQGRLSNLLPMPLNTGRHTLSIELRKRDCPGSWINSFMGHSDVGREPGSRFSSLGFEYLNEIKNKYLEPIALEQGWKIHLGLHEKDQHGK